VAHIQVGDAQIETESAPRATSRATDQHTPRGTRRHAVGTDALAIFAFFPGGLLAPVTIICAGIMLWRTHIFPWWIDALLIAGGVLFVISAPESVCAIVLASDVVLIEALFPIACTMLTSGRVPSPAPTAQA
jgi:hypothetical protein